MELPGRYAKQCDTRDVITFLLHVFCTFSMFIILTEIYETTLTETSVRLFLAF